ncbi:MAG: DUF3108 domain-containing protein [Pseudomonadota bacterium]
MLRVLALCLPALLLVTPATSDEGAFTVSLAGIRAGIIAFSGEETGGGRYTARGSARSSGLVGSVLDISIDTVAIGRVDGNTYRPSNYRQTGKEGDNVRDMKFTYRGGVPAVTRTPPRELPDHVARPANQAGTIDPTTTAFAMLRDRPRDLLCELNVDLYDGRRRANIRYTELKSGRNGGFVCKGEYRREQGFTPEELAERPFWPFSVIYTPLGNDLYRVAEVRVPTTFGPVRLRRR